MAKFRVYVKKTQNAVAPATYARILREGLSIVEKQCKNPYFPRPCIIYTNWVGWGLKLRPEWLPKECPEGTRTSPQSMAGVDPMNKALTILAFLPILLATGCQPRSEAIKPARDVNQPGKIYIPKDMNDCFAELERMLDPNVIKEIKESHEEDLVRYHFGIGLWMRNNWGLWGGSRLQKYFLDLGFRHPDDMSGVIIICFWRHLNGLPIGLEEEAEMSRYCAQIWQEPTDPTCPEHRVPIQLAYELGGQTMKDGKKLPRCVHVGRCSRDMEVWVYEYGQNWYKPEGSLRERIRELDAEGSANLEFAPIEKPVLRPETSAHR
jgi:hypothetical protein